MKTEFAKMNMDIEKKRFSIKLIGFPYIDFKTGNLTAICEFSSSYDSEIKKREYISIIVDVKDKIKIVKNDPIKNRVIWSIPINTIFDAIREQKRIKKKNHKNISKKMKFLLNILLNILMKLKT
jgi:hypothetical protein